MPSSTYTFHPCLTLLSFSTLTPSIVTLVIGSEQRIFAAHEDVLCASPWFQSTLSSMYMDTDSANNKRIHLPDEEPEIFSSILEYLYKGDYYPRLVHNKKRNSWEMEQPDEGRSALESTIYHHAVDGDILKDTVIYCTAQKYGLEELKRVALRKQGLRELPSLLNLLLLLVTNYHQSRASNAAPSWRRLAMRTTTRLTPTPS